jgi:hypothetical protein
MTYDQMEPALGARRSAIGSSHRTSVTAVPNAELGTANADSEARR